MNLLVWYARKQNKCSTVKKVYMQNSTFTLQSLIGSANAIHKHGGLKQTKALDLPTITKVCCLETFQVLSILEMANETVDLTKTLC